MSKRNAHEQNQNKLRSSVNDILGLIAEYPRLALPVGAVAAVFTLASVFKTLIDGFGWAYTNSGIPGVLVVVSIIAVGSLLVIWLTSNALQPRPVIGPVARHCLSRNPIIKWDYAEQDQSHASFELVVKQLHTNKVTRIKVPKRMYQVAIPEITGDLNIHVRPMIGRREGRRSRMICTEIYGDSVERLRVTGKLRIAVHTDPAEKVFCYYLNGEWQGLDIRFATLLAAELGADREIGRKIDVEYYFFEWPAIIGAPAAHEVDMAIASITISQERAEKYGVAFSLPYARSRFGVVAGSDAFKGKRPGDPVPFDMLKGKTIGIHQETMALAFMEKVIKNSRYGDITIRTAANNDELRELLRDNKVEAVFHDYYRAYTLIERDMAVFALDSGEETPGDSYGIALSKVNSRLLEMVNRILTKHQVRITSALDSSIEKLRRAFVPLDTATSPETDRPAISGPTNLFVYGTLMFEPVWKRLVKSDFKCRRAHLSGYRRLRIRNENYPGMIRGNDIVRGLVWENIDEQTLHFIDEFEAPCYRRAPGVVIDDDTGAEIRAHFYVVKEDQFSILEDAEWDPEEFKSSGLASFLEGYSGFKNSQ